jgi:hypothetical protein
VPDPSISAKSALTCPPIPIFKKINDLEAILGTAFLLGTVFALGLGWNDQ